MASIESICKQSPQAVKTYLSEKYNLYLFFSECDKKYFCICYGLFTLPNLDSEWVQQKLSMAT